LFAAITSAVALAKSSIEAGTSKPSILAELISRAL
jgi:hypothetical protein